MNAARDIVAVRRWPAALRWGVCLTLALGLHAAGAAALLARWSENADSIASAPVIMIELAALPVAPDTTPTEAPPGPQQSDVQPQPEPEKPVEKPVEKIVELPPEPKAEPQLAVMPPPKPLERPGEKKPKPKRASLASAPSTAEHRAARAAAPMPGASARNPDAVPSWKSQLVARLERYKRYPSQAQSRGEQGVAQLAFSIDRRGGVHHARILRSSGSSLLDQATLDLIERAAPMPPPPPEITGAQIAIVVPIHYGIR